MGARSPIAATSAALKVTLKTTAPTGDLGPALTTATFRVNSMRGSQYIGFTVTVCGVPVPGRHLERNALLGRVAQYVHSQIAPAHPRAYVEVRADGWPAGHSIAWRTDETPLSADQN